MNHFYEDETLNEAFNTRFIDWLSRTPTGMFSSMARKPFGLYAPFRQAINPAIEDYKSIRNVNKILKNSTSPLSDKVLKYLNISGTKGHLPINSITDMNNATKKIGNIYNRATNAGINNLGLDNHLVSINGEKIPLGVLSNKQKLKEYYNDKYFQDNINKINPTGNAKIHPKEMDRIRKQSDKDATNTVNDIYSKLEKNDVNTGNIPQNINNINIKNNIPSQGSSKGIIKTGANLALKTGLGSLAGGAILNTAGDIIPKDSDTGKAASDIAYKASDALYSIPKKEVEIASIPFKDAWGGTKHKLDKAFANFLPDTSPSDKPGDSSKPNTPNKPDGNGKNKPTNKDNPSDEDTFTKRLSDLKDTISNKYDETVTTLGGTKKAGENILKTAGAVGAAGLGGYALTKVIRNLKKKSNWYNNGCDSIEDPAEKRKCQTFQLNNKIEDLKTEYANCDDDFCKESIKSQIKDLYIQLDKLEEF